MKNLQGSNVLKLLIAVDELNIQPLISHVQEFLIERKTEFLQQNPIERFISMKHLQICLETICEEPNTLFNSDKFINLKAPYC